MFEHGMNKPNRYPHVVRKGADIGNLSVEEKQRSPDETKGKEVKYESLESLKGSDTWELVDFPKGVKVIPCKWVSKLKPRQ